MSTEALEKKEVKEITTSIGNLSIKVSDGARTSISKAFDLLIKERKDWQSNEYLASNTRLYGICQNCYAMYQEMKGVTGEKLALKRAFNSYASDMGLNFKESTHLMVKIVRVVFGDNLRRVSTYARALRIAEEKKTSVIDIPRFLQDAGGIEEVRRESKSSKKSKSDKKDKGLQLMKVKSLAEVQSDALNGNFDEGAYEGAVVLMSTREADGSFQIKHVIQNGAIITNSLIHLVSLNKEELEKAKVEEQAANDEVSRDEAIKQAVNA
jgi:hypothetical protein